jgi:hypothetical protein
MHVVITNYANWKPPAGKPLAKEKGLNVHTCECGETVWAFPWSDELAAWDSHVRHPLRSYIEDKGLAPPEPRVSHHVVFASPEDAGLLRSRRWRVYPSKLRTRHKVELRGGTGRGLPLQRHVLGREDCVRITNRYGCDVRRTNLRRMTRKEIAADRHTRKAPQQAAVS